MMDVSQIEFVATNDTKSPKPTYMITDELLRHLMRRTISAHNTPCTRNSIYSNCGI
jgi:hypothetical protein